MNAVAALKALFAVQPRQFTPLSAVGTPRGRHDRHPLHSRKSLKVKSKLTSIERAYPEEV